MKLTAKFRMLRKAALVMVFLLVYQIVFPVAAYALTSGPTQPEFQAFEPVGTTEMVDLFSGDFTYNIPLFDLPGPNGGYPFNISYKPETNIDAESGPFGLGWTINPGVINRSMRGIPDDADGSLDENENPKDVITTTTSIRDNWTVGGGLGINGEIFGIGPDLTLTLGRSVYYNSYKGVGLKTTIGLNFPLGACSGPMAGLNLSMDSQEGTTLSGSLTLSDQFTRYGASYGAGIGVNSRSGLSGLSLSSNAKTATTVKTDDGNRRSQLDKEEGISGGSAISFGGVSATPTVDMPWRGSSANLKFKLGAGAWGFFANGYVSGFYSHQKLAKKGKPVKTPAFGYWNMHKAGENTNVMLDFNRVKDGPVSKKTLNLAVPNTTPDVYSLSGQGTGGMFRAYRSDMGILHTNDTKSYNTGANLSADAFFFKAGFQAGINYSHSAAGKWKKGNGLYNENGNDYDFQSQGSNLFEPAYFKMQGEHNAENEQGELSSLIGGFGPMEVKIDKMAAENFFLDKDGNAITPAKKRTNRNPRTTGILPLKNSDLYYDEDNDGTNDSPLKEFDIEVENATGGIIPYNRRNNNHFGAFISYDPSGMRYNYGLPAYNDVHRERLFSVDGETTGCGPNIDVLLNGNEVKYKHGGSVNYFKKTEMPSYVHAYLLTSVLGADYVDVDNNGPSDDDKGYWVKFGYKKIHDDFKWRAPYTGYNFMEGYRAKNDDDKASFLYGEKEIWNLKKVETKTHVAVFELSERTDGKEAKGELVGPGEGTGSGSLMRVDKIKLYTKNEYNTNPNPKPLKTVHFEYEYDLCPNTENSISGGKLTLTSISFTYDNSSRGELSPYVFSYEGSNEEYAVNRHDRWGTYKEPRGYVCENVDFPYTPQFDPAKTKEQFEDDIVADATSWSLSSITLPSGSTIEIKSEPKSYGHVQNRVATQMFNIVSTQKYSETGYNSCNPDYEPERDLKLYDRLFSNDLKNKERKLFFPLEYPIDPNTSDAEMEVEMRKYFEDLHPINGNENVRQVYYKVRAQLRNGSDIYEDVAGYAEVVLNNFGKDASYQSPQGGNPDFGVDESSLCDGKYRWGFVTLGEAKIGNDVEKKYHPFSLATWQFMKTDLPDQAFSIGDIDPNAPKGAKAIRKLLSTILSPTVEMQTMFSGFYNYCKARGFAQKIQQQNSFIKLNSPDKEKYGGGVRVKSIVLKDNWEIEPGTADPDTYGQVYHYEDGVASNEPSIGGDENAMRYARNYKYSVPLASAQNLFSEYPMNENYFPGASIGHGKVTVTSLATHLGGMDDNELQEFGVDPDDLPEGFATTGKVVNEFYTAKEFPVVTQQTEINLGNNGYLKRRQIPYFPFGQTILERTTMSQGYAIELNDMHGKPKKISHYGQDSDGNFSEKAESWVRYNYQSKIKTVDKRDIKVLDSEVDVLLSNTPDSSGDLPREKKNVGVDVETFNDMRLFNSRSASIGGQFNIDGIFFLFGVIPIPTIWPEVSFHSTRMRLAVNNKVIHRSGILKSTTAFDNGSYVQTNNLLYDGMTGQPVLTSVNNSYKGPGKSMDKIYNYNVKGHLVYDGMGAAYKNLGATFDANVSFRIQVGKCTDWWVVNNIPASILPHLVEGDEFIVTNANQKLRAYYMGEEDNKQHFDIPGIVPNGTASFKLVRSARRNHLSTSVGNITAKHDPTLDRTQVANCEVEYFDPTLLTINSGPSTSSVDLEFLNLLITNNQLGGIKTYQPLELNDSNFAYYNDFLNTGYAQIGYNYIIRDHNFKNASFYFAKVDHYSLCSNSRGDSPAVTCCQIKFVDSDSKSYLLSIESILTNTYDPQTGTIDIVVQDGTNPDITIPVEITYCGGFQPKGEIVELTGNKTEISYYKMDEVLATSATTFKDTWSTEQAEIVVPMAATDTKNPYITGEKGIWRPHKAFTYVEARNQAGDGGVASTAVTMKTILDSKNDGVFDAVPAFEYDQLFFENCNNWVMTNEMTQYSGNNELENKNIIDQYSSAIYGYSDNLAVAVAANARHNEFGFESFEEYGIGMLSAVANNANQAELTGQIDILPLPNGTEKLLYDEYPIVTGNDNLLVVDRNNSPNWNPTTVELSIQTFDMEDYFVTADIQEVLRVIDENGNYDDSKTALKFEITSGCNADFIMTESWFGKAAFPRIVQQTGAITGTNAEITNSRAHTGEKSLKIASSGGTFLQNSINLIEGEEYVLSLWISEENKNQPTFQNGNLLFMNDPFTSSISPTGEVINGWQRVEGTFTATGDDALHVGADQDFYLDDIRIFPADGNMQSYVYDTENYRLKATLDNNNYATIYLYDADGNVKVVKKETTEGIVTIQENHSFVKPQN